MDNRALSSQVYFRGKGLGKGEAGTHSFESPDALPFIHLRVLSPTPASAEPALLLRALRLSMPPPPNLDYTAANFYFRKKLILCRKPER